MMNAARVRRLQTVAAVWRRLAAAESASAAGRAAAAEVNRLSAERSRQQAVCDRFRNLQAGIASQLIGLVHRQLETWQLECRELVDRHRQAEVELQRAQSRLVAARRRERQFELLAERLETREKLERARHERRDHDELAVGVHHLRLRVNELERG